MVGTEAMTKEMGETCLSMSTSILSMCEEIQKRGLGLSWGLQFI